MTNDLAVEEPVDQEALPATSRYRGLGRRIPACLLPPPLVIPPYVKFPTPEAAVPAVGTFCTTPETAPGVESAGVRSVVQRAPPGLPEPDAFDQELEFAYLRAQTGLLPPPPGFPPLMEALRAPPGLPPPSGLALRPPPGFQSSDRTATSIRLRENEAAPELRPPPGLVSPPGLAVRPPPGFQSCDRSASVQSFHVADDGPAPMLRPPPGLSPPSGFEQGHPTHVADHEPTPMLRPPPGLPPPPGLDQVRRWRWSCSHAAPASGAGTSSTARAAARHGANTRARPSAPPVVRVAAGPPQASQQAGSLSLDEIWADGKQRTVLTEWTARQHELSTPVPMHERILGQGTFGTVYLIVDTGNSIVAVKKTPCGPYDTVEKAVQYCNAAVNEADLHEKATASRCPYVIGLLGACISNYSLWVKMEVAPAGDLMQFCGRTPFTGHIRDKPALLYMGACLVITVNQLFAIGISHRDIKPNNILLDAKGRLKLGDFNLATTELYNNTEYAGTSEFMAPEIKPIGTTASSTSYGWKSDLWSIGATVEYLCKDTPTPAVKQMIDALKKVDPSDRPGLGAFRQLPCFAKYDWDAMVNGTAEAPE